MFTRKNKFPVQGRLVLITGGSQGLGEAIAIDFAKKGANLVLVARNEDKLKQALKKVEAERVSPEQKFSYVSADLSRVEGAKKAVVMCGQVPDIVICNAGASIPGFFADQAPETIEFNMQTNYMTAVWTAHAAINAMIRAPQEPGMPKRKLVFIASLASFCSIVGYTSYSPAKAAVRQLADSLREECILYDIDVHCAFPANILTPGFEEEEKTKPDLTRKMEGPAGGETPEVVAARIIKKLEGGDEHITYEFVGTMLKNMMLGMTPRDHPIYDWFTGLIGSIAWPFIRRDYRKMIRNYREEHGKRELPSWP